jgi:hypothetical protein
MSYFHKDLTEDHWFNMSIDEQMANIGSEALRAISLKKKELPENMWNSIDRMLDLLDLTIKDSKNILRLRELTRVREVFLDHLLFDDQYGATNNFWEKYFLFFGLRARRNKLENKENK